MDIKQITHHIRRLCFEKMMSLAQLAKLTGLTRGCASKIENASKAPPFSTLNKIANALNLDVNMLMAGSSESHENQSLCIVRKDERKEVVSRGVWVLIRRGPKFRASCTHTGGRNGFAEEVSY